MAQHNGNWGSAWDFMRGLAVGSVTGATVTLLFAPRSGKETRELIIEKGDELRGKVSQTALETREQIAQFTEQAKRQAGELADKVTGRANPL
jgi:gas vesicle protein